MKMARDKHELEFEQALEDNIVDVKNKVYTHVTVQYGEEKSYHQASAWYEYVFL